MADGASCNVGRLSLSLHNGTHVDAPYHYAPRGVTMEKVPLEIFVGPARVVDARGSGAVTAALFENLSPAEIAAAPRILFRTDAWTDPTVFPSTWPLLEPGLARWLAERGVCLIGVDVPSVDALKSRELPRHHEFDAARVIILENLDLRAVPAGDYELIALPLHIEGADASPVRAVLRKT
jgi:arylformamidase